MLKIEEPYNTPTTLKVTGTLKEVEAWKIDYFRSYHPAGYGTYERSRETNSDGTVTIWTRRASSCD